MKINILGNKKPDSETLKLKKLDGLTFKVSDSYSTLGEDTLNEAEFDQGDIIEITLNDKIKLHLSAISFQTLFPKHSKNSSLNLVDCELQTHDMSSQTNLINIHSIRLIKKIPNNPNLTDTHSEDTPPTPLDIINKLENDFVKDPGIYNCAELNRKMHKVQHPLRKISTRQPVLLLIHGIVSNTENTFSDLWHSVESHLWIDHIEDNYQSHVYAFEHQTLSKSPIENALDLVRLLPKGTRLHLLTHSRGGLIGELLSRGQVENNSPPFTDEEIELFGHDKATLEALNFELINKKITIERFVRVACPSRGTNFADHRPDIYFSILLNTLGLIPALKNSDLYNFVHDLLFIFATHPIKIKDLPGLATMLPDATLVRTLNGSSVRSDADLSIIAGDIEGAGAFKILELLTTQFFFLEQHDLIVNTSSMTGGVRRSNGVRRFFHQGPQVSHFHYFSNPVSLEYIVEGLDWKTMSGPEGFETLKSTRKQTRSASKTPEFDPKKASVVIIPGIFGSHIKPDNARIWIDWNALTRGDFSQLKLPVSTHHTDAEDGLVTEKYAALIQFLSQHYNVIPFPYDWRLSSTVVAKRLVEVLNKQLLETRETALPIHLLAHSTGGLIARLVPFYNAKCWQEMVNRNSRLLMLGTPHRGSFAVSRLLMGEDRLSKLLTIAHFKNKKKSSTEAKTLKVLTSFPGLLELMPLRSDFNFYSSKSWKSLAEKSATPAIPEYKTLKAAKELQTTYLHQALIDENMFSVLGSSPETPNKTVNEQGKWVFINGEQGDGFSTWQSSRLPNVHTWYMSASHGEMASHEPAFPALFQILETGDTHLLQNSVKALDHSAQVGRPSLYRSIIFPTKHELLDTATSVIAKTVSQNENPSQISVQVTHGDLTHAQYPVLSGHYDGESIRSSDIQFDLMLDGYLTKSFELGLFPGPIRTSEVFIKTEGTLKGTIVVGLGRIGTLTTNKLKLTITYGLLDYIRTLEIRKVNHGGVLGISFLLFASNDGGLPLEDVLIAALRGVIDANAALKSNLLGQLRISHIEFIERYLDKAAKAAYYLKGHAISNEFRSTLKLRQFINSMPGGKERITHSKISNRWQSLQIVKSAEGELCFTSLTKKARAEATLISTQRKLIDNFIHSSISTIASDSGLSTTLFELIVPLELKSTLHEQADMQLILDEDTARYPWELLQGRKDLSDKPFAVQSGIVRQLIMDDYRRQPSLSQYKSVLVVGDPLLGDESTHFKPLPGARAEANLVASKLDSLGYECNLMVEEKSDAIIQALYEKPYRIIHLAGHGVYQFSASKKSHHTDKTSKTNDSYTGMVLGDGIYLSAKEISQMSNVPDIVFVNCCHGGFIEESTEANKLAANLASQLIKNGVICVIAAGWAVDDYAAKVFAEQFYLAMLGHNETFGKAVQLARQKVYEDNPSINTWGAYQCYGPHDFRMQRVDNYVENQATTSIKKSTDFTLPKELTLALDARSKELLQNRSAATEMQAVREELKILTRSLPPVWRKDGLLLSAIGNIYCILGELSPMRSANKLSDLKSAHDYYQKAFNAEISNFSFDAIEQFAHVEMCRAECLMHNGEYSWSNVYDTAIQKLNHLTDIAPNSYRFELLGEAYKNKALLLADKVSLVEIDAMQEAYAKARIITEIKTGLLEPSSALNYLLATVAKSMLELKQANSMEYKHWIDQLGSIFFQLKQEDKTLQNAINVLDNELVSVFLDASLANKEYKEMDSIKDQLTELGKAYQRILEYFDPDDSERSSCMRNVNFLYQVSEKIRSAQGHEINQLLMILSRAGAG